MSRVLRRVIAKPDLEDEHHVKNEKERFVRFSVSPFKRKRRNTEGEEEEEESEPPPEWLELSGDLAWTASFSSLTSNTGVSSHSTVSSYAVFFTLLWPLWATQTIYDLRYYSNDWWHRIFFVLQLSVYASMASFSGSFNVFWEIAYTNEDGFVGNTTDTQTAQAITLNARQTDLRSFKGVNLILMISRTLLLIQYLRILWYRRNTPGAWSWRHLVTPISLAVSASAFLLAFVIIDTIEPSKSVAICQMLLWLVAVIVQISGSIHSPDDPKGALKTGEPISPRLGNLTVIILGEGLNGICSTLRQSLGHLGLAPTIFGDAIALAFIMYCLWLLYFDGFRVYQTHAKEWEQVWVWSHLPFHLCLILMLEGLKNTFLYTTMMQALDFFVYSFTNFMRTGDVKDVNHLREICLSQGQSWDALVNGWQSTYNTTHNGTGYSTALAEQEYTWYFTTINNLVNMYQQQPDAKAQYLFTNFIANTTQVLDDVNDPDMPLWTALWDRYLVTTDYSNYWVLQVSGVVLILLALLNIMHRRPKDRFVWSYAVLRLIAGIVLLVIGFTVRVWMVHSTWIIGAVSIVFVGTAIIDQLFLYLSVRTIRTMEKRRSLHPSMSEERIDLPNLPPVSEVGYEKEFEVKSPTKQQERTWQAQPFLEGGK